MEVCEAQPSNILFCVGQEDLEGCQKTRGANFGEKPEDKRQLTLHFSVLSWELQSYNMPQLLTNVRIVFSTCALCKETNVLWPAICKGVTTTMGEARRSAQVQKCSGGRNGNSWVILLPARDVMLLNLSLYIDPTKASSIRKILDWLMHSLTKKPSEHLASASKQGWVCVTPKGLWVFSEQVLFLSCDTNGLGKKGCPNLLLCKQEFGWVAPLSTGHTAHIFDKRCSAGQRTPNQCKQLWSCTDKMLAPAIYLQGLLLISFCPQLCQYVGAAPLPLVPALCSGAGVRKQHLGCHLHLGKSSHTQSRARMSHTELTVSTRLSQTIWFCCPFIKCKLKKLWNSRQ